MKLAICALLACIAIVALLGVRIAIKSFRAERADYVRTPSQPISRHPERTGIAGLREVAIAAGTDLRIAGWYAPSRNRAAVVLMHGTGADRSAMLFETAMLASAGFGVLAIDGPGQGASQGVTRWGGPERRAISAAVDWLSSRAEVDPARIGGFGTSMGAYVMVQAAVLDVRLRALTIAASPSDVVEQNWHATAHWGILSQLPCYLALRIYGQSLDMRPTDVIGSIAPRPVFILGGALDGLVPRYMAEQLYAAAGEPKELWIVANAHHVDYGQVAPAEYRRRVTEFFVHTLLEPAPG